MSGKVAFNLQPLASGNLTGIGYYTQNVMSEIIKSGRFSSAEFQAFDFLGRNNAADTLTERLFFKGSENIRIVKSMPLGAYIRAGKAGKVFPYEKLLKSEADLTVFFNYLSPQGLTGKNIITIYDMVVGRYPDTMDDRNRKLLERHLQKSADNAEHIVTISEFSRNEIAEQLSIPKEKISVAYCGVDTGFYCPANDVSDKEIVRKYTDDKYILYVGTLEPRKNIPVLLDAFRIVSSKNPSLKLILAGKLGWHSEGVSNAIETSPVKDRIILTGYISDTEKRALYRNAEAFVFPSLYEGFGMPPIEAMACGTGCVCADTSSLPEVTKGNALLFSSDDYEEAASLIIKMIEMKSDNSLEIDSFIKTASEYKWKKTSDVFMNVIDSCLK